MEKATHPRFKSSRRVNRDERARARFAKSWEAAAWQAYGAFDDDLPYLHSHAGRATGETHWWHDESPNTWAYEESGEWPAEAFEEEEEEEEEEE